MIFTDAVLCLQLFTSVVCLCVYVRVSPFVCVCLYFYIFLVMLQSALTCSHKFPQVDLLGIPISLKLCNMILTLNIFVTFLQLYIRVLCLSSCTNFNKNPMLS